MQIDFLDRMSALVAPIVRTMLTKLLSAAQILLLLQMERSSGDGMQRAYRSRIVALIANATIAATRVTPAKPVQHVLSVMERELRQPTRSEAHSANI